jgi:hypothetical protein
MAQALDIPFRIPAAAHGSDGRMSLSQFDRAACAGCNFLTAPIAETEPLVRMARTVARNSPVGLRRRQVCRECQFVGVGPPHNRRFSAFQSFFSFFCGSAGTFSVEQLTAVARLTLPFSARSCAQARACNGADGRLEQLGCPIVAPARQQSSYGMEFPLCNATPY